MRLASYVNALECKTAFVTGGTGFIGSHLAESLLQRGYSEVRCLVRSKRKWLSGIDIIPVRATLMDKSAIIEAVSGVGLRVPPRWRDARDKLGRAL